MKHILIVCDNAETTELLEFQLKVQGHRVSTAVDAMSGLKLVIEHKPDLVIADICLTSGGGFLFTYRLRDKVPTIPVLLIATHKQEGLTEIMRNVGAVGCFGIPHQSADLMVAVTLALASWPTSPIIPEQPPEPQFTAPKLVATSGSSTLITHPPTPRPRAAISGRHMILIVEDDRRIAQALSLRLRAAGQDVLMAYDAVSALMVYKKNNPEVVLLDIGLPGGDGLVVAERIQRVGLRQSPIIFITASRQPGLREKAMALGAVAYLEKPYEVDELIAAIMKALYPDNEQ